MTAAGLAGADPTVRAIRQAAASTGVDFAYMLAQAAIESGFDPRAQAPTSSARGLYQFTDATWLAMVRDHGADIGIGRHAARIVTDGDGRAVVKDKAARAEILSLRDDPRLSSELAARLALENRAAMEETLGAGRVGATELYLAHFLGAGQATRFLIGLRARPDADAARMFPVEAKANPGVFLDENGHGRSLRAIHDRFARKLEDAIGGVEPAAFATAMATTAPRRDPVDAPRAGPSPAAPAAGWRPGHRYAQPLDPLVVLVLASLDAPAPAQAKRPASPATA